MYNECMRKDQIVVFVICDLRSDIIYKNENKNAQNLILKVWVILIFLYIIRLCAGLFSDIYRYFHFNLPTSIYLSAFYKII